MGLIGKLIEKGVTTSLRNSTIKTVGNVAVDVISTAAQNQKTAVVKKGVLYIKPTRSSGEYIDKNVIDISRELLGAGFESITLKPVKKLGNKSWKKYGRIRFVSINGNTDYRGVKKVPASSKIVIEYLDFKNDVDQEAYANVQRIGAGVIHTISDIEATSHKNNISANKSFKKFCSYCGEPLQNEKARFCAFCGQEI